MRVAACLVTRGDVDMTDIVDSIPHEWEICLWDNSVRQDLGVYGRYAAISLTDAEYIFTQDDDAVLAAESFEAINLMAVPGAIVTNMPERFRPHYPDSCLVGFGAIFQRELPFMAFDKVKDIPADFNLTCDVYFTTLTQWFPLDLPYNDQPWASDANRMWKQPEHVPMRAAALAHARSLR